MKGGWTALGFFGLAGWVWAQPSPGSLYVSNGRLAAATRDLKAANVGDIVTILVNDSASAVATGATNTSRKTSAKSSLALLGSSNPRLANMLTSSGDQELQSQGTTSRNMALTTTISARVTAVTSDGALAIEGVKNIGVNSEKQTVVVRGVVRPVDLTTANTVTSGQVADLSIQVNGKGVVGDAIRRPHFLYRLLLGLLPF
ncbi:MAG TPA: flagellar basal body L-ring protein FlgH [Bryobacteraceae bacterium]|nr:flagellar basal body L-ring protein FlgH [Bryobacteraceae bacterium]